MEISVPGLLQRVPAGTQPFLQPALLPKALSLQWQLVVDVTQLVQSQLPAPTVIWT